MRTFLEKLFTKALFTVNGTSIRSHRQRRGGGNEDCCEAAGG